MFNLKQNKTLFWILIAIVSALVAALTVLLILKKVLKKSDDEELIFDEPIDIDFLSDDDQEYSSPVIEVVK